MMTPCKKLYYAVEAVLYIAYYSDDAPISSRDIAFDQGLPPRHLEQIMQKLVHGNILRGQRGPKGGYQLARPASEICVSDICEILREDDLISDTPSTTPLGDGVVRPFWEALHESVKNRLMLITIADLCMQAQRQNISKRLPARRLSSA